MMNEGIVFLISCLHKFLSYDSWFGNHHTVSRKRATFRSQGPLVVQCLLGCRIVCRQTQQDQVCRSTLSNGCRVCVLVCILSSIIRTGCLTPYVHSVQGSWENKDLRGPQCYCYLPPLQAVFEDRK